jgi:hypothetical protein
MSTRWALAVLVAPKGQLYYRVLSGPISYFS